MIELVDAVTPLAAHLAAPDKLAVTLLTLDLSYFIVPIAAAQQLTAILSSRVDVALPACRSSYAQRGVVHTEVWRLPGVD